MIKPRNTLTAAKWIGIVLIVIAGNLDSPRWWLLLPGWIIVVTCIAVWIAATPSPYDHFGFPLVLFVLYFGLSRSGYQTLIDLIFRPTVNHLQGLLLNKVFLR
ncbi:MAG: hypothetical protein ABJC10_04300 [Acidobacteriota bacterium]